MFSRKGRSQVRVRDGVIGSDRLRSRYNDVESKITPERKVRMQKMAEVLAKQDVYIAMDPVNLNRVLDEGRFKTAHETGRSNGYFDSSTRQAFEKEMFEDTPIYGYLSDSGISSRVTTTYPDRGNPRLEDDVASYGSARIKLKTSVRDQSTFVSNDSWDNAKGAVLYNDADYKSGVPFGLRFMASPVNNPSYKSIMAGMSDNAYTNFDPSPAKRFSYAEVQIFGRVSASDIDHVSFYGGRSPSKSLTKKLEKMGITWDRREFNEISVD